MTKTLAHPNATQSLQVKIVPLYNDNYAWLLHNQKHAWIIDPGQAEPIIAQLKQLNVTLKGMLVTHCHWDHVSGIEGLKQIINVPVYGTMGSHPEINHGVAEGDSLNFDGTIIEVWQTPGHMADHLSFYCKEQNWLFCGDTLFSIGCGRLKQTGSMPELYNSLQRFKQLPPHTQVYCSHEYTLSNLAFAKAVDANNQAITTYQRQVADLRKMGKASIPSTIATELACNPFLRLEHPTVASSVANQLGTSATQTHYSTFKALREWKDRF